MGPGCSGGQRQPVHPDAAVPGSTVGRPPAKRHVCWTVTGMGERCDDVRCDADGHVMFRGRDGAPMTLQQFAQAFQDVAYKIVARTELVGCVVTTAWLGTDQGDGADTDTPLIFGTIVQRDGVFDDRSERFSATEQQALATHDATVAAARSM
jgi:hypothetical protein